MFVEYNQKLTEKQGVTKHKSQSFICVLVPVFCAFKFVIFMIVY